MKLSTRGRYALRMMLDIARNGADGKPVSLAAVSARTDISRGYLEQLALALRNARLLKGVSGRYGGYRLTRPANEITLSRVIEAAIGPINVVDCVDSPEECLRSDMCECRTVYQLINRRITEVLDDYTLADLNQGKLATLPLARQTASSSTD
jgi:Rrf2 family protein